MSDAMLKRCEVEKLTGLSRSSIYRLMRIHEFPEPVRVGQRAVRWPSTVIDEFLESRPAASGEAG